MPGGGGDTTTTQKFEPWGPTKGPLRQAVNEAARVKDNGGFFVNSFKGDRVADFTATEQMGRDQILSAAQGARGIMRDVASGYSDTLGDARGAVREVSTGGQGNLDAVTQGILRDVIPAVNSSFANSGMTGSDLHADTAARAATEALAPAMFQANEAMQGRQLQAQGMNQGADSANFTNALRAFGMAPEIIQGQIMPGQITAGLGESERLYDQAGIDARMGRHYEKENARKNALTDYASLLLGYGGSGGASSSTQPDQGPGTVGSLLGAGATGLGAYGALAAIPGVGAPLAIGGGLLSGLAGLF